MESWPHAVEQPVGPVFAARPSAVTAATLPVPSCSRRAGGSPNRCRRRRSASPAPPIPPMSCCAAPPDCAARSRCRRSPAACSARAMANCRSAASSRRSRRCLRCRWPMPSPRPSRGPAGPSAGASRRRSGVAASSTVGSGGYHSETAAPSAAPHDPEGTHGSDPSQARHRRVAEEGDPDRQLSRLRLRRGVLSRACPRPADRGCRGAREVQGREVGTHGGERRARFRAALCRGVRQEGHDQGPQGTSQGRRRTPARHRR